MAACSHLLYEAQKKTPEAIAEYQRSAELQPDHPDAAGAARKLLAESGEK